MLTPNYPDIDAFIAYSETRMGPDDWKAHLYNPTGGKRLIKKRTLLSLLKKDWANSNALFSLERSDRYYDRDARISNYVFRWSGGTRLDFDEEAGFTNATELYDFLNSKGLAPGVIVQTSEKCFHAVLWHTKSCFMEQNIRSASLALARELSKLVDLDMIAPLYEVKIPGTISNGAFLCKGFYYDSPHVDVIEWVKNNCLGQAAGTGPLADPEVLSLCLDSYLSCMGSTKDVSEEIINDEIGQKGATVPQPALYTPKFQEVILGLLQSLKLSNFRNAVPLEDQATYLADNLGRLNKGNCGIAIKALMKQFGIADRTAQKLRTQWDEAMIIKVAKPPVAKVFCTEYKTGETLKAVVKPTLSVPELIEVLQDVNPLIRGESWVNGMVWYRTLKNGGLGDTAILDVLINHDDGTNRDWHRHLKSLRGSYRSLKQR